MIRKESAETQDYVSYHDMEVDSDKSLEEAGLVLSTVIDSAGWHEPLRVKYMSTCATKQCDEQGFTFYDVAAMLVEDDGKLHTITSAGAVMTAGWQKVAKQK